LPKVFPRVGIDEHAVGRMAAEHFLERGFRQFAVAGMAGHVYSAQRLEGYRSALTTRGFDCTDLDPVVDLTNATQSIAPRLAELPRRTAIYCCNDTRAQHVIAAAEKIGRRVPEDLAVLGTDNDELTCLLVAPTLSSVMISGERIGQSAAELAARLADGHAPPREPILIPPSGIAERESTDVIAPTDPAVAIAMRILADRFAEPIDADQIVQGTAMSRRSLERRFRETLGHGIFETLRQIRVRQARHLLVSTDIPLKEIATRCGFSDQYRFSTVFRQLTGKAPGVYRRENRV
jgi:LacI family transcriptional regulator